MTHKKTYENVLRAKLSGDRNALNEASLGRVFQHVTNSEESSWGILTSYRGNNAPSKNKSDFKQLKGLLRSYDLGFFILKGHWRECILDNVAYKNCPEDRVKDVAEPSLFVPGISLKEINTLSKKYNQDAWIYSGPDTNGEVILIMNDMSRINLGRFKPSKVAQAYSKVKGSSFIFEYVAQSYWDTLIESRVLSDIASIRDKR